MCYNAVAEYSCEMVVLCFRGKILTVTYIEIFLKIMILTAPVYILVRWLVLKYRRKEKIVHSVDVKRELLMGLFFLYLTGILAMTLVMDAEFSSLTDMVGRAQTRISSGEGINLIPFQTITRFFRSSTDRDVFLINIVGNIIMFVPWGAGIVLLWKKNRNWLRIILWSAGLPVFIEGMQLFVGRSVDVDDWILNFMGSLLGGFFCLTKTFPYRYNKNRCRK